MVFVHEGSRDVFARSQLSVFVALSDAGEQRKREEDAETDEEEEEEREYAKCTDVRASQWRQVELYLAEFQQAYGAVPLFASYVLTLH
jgi:hypothetical protein